MKLFWPRAICAVALLFVGVASYYSYASYFARYYFVAAKRGQKSSEAYEALLRRVLNYDASFGYANLEYARLHIFQRKYGAALTLQEEGMKSFRPLRSYEQMGTIQARLGHTDNARRCFEQTVRMFPNNVPALEQLALIASAQGNSERLEELVSAILRLDMGNLNVRYLRARDAERQGERAAALIEYERISSALSRRQNSTERFWFERREIESHLLQLRQARPKP